MWGILAHLLFSFTHRQAVSTTLSLHITVCLRKRACNLLFRFSDRLFLRMVSLRILLRPQIASPQVASRYKPNILTARSYPKSRGTWGSQRRVSAWSLQRDLDALATLKSPVGWCRGIVTSPACGCQGIVTHDMYMYVHMYGYRQLDS